MLYPYMANGPKRGWIQVAQLILQSHSIKMKLTSGFKNLKRM